MATSALHNKSSSPLALQILVLDPWMAEVNTFSTLCISNRTFFIKSKSLSNLQNLGVKELSNKMLRWFLNFSVCLSKASVEKLLKPLYIMLAVTSPYLGILLKGYDLIFLTVWVGNVALAILKWLKVYWIDY